MVRLIDIHDLREMIRRLGVESFLTRLVTTLEEDYAGWADFEKRPRLASHGEHGVIELMPISGRGRYAFKYVNGHPRNPASGRQTVVAVGLLANAETGYPLLLSEMTFLTALRTAATSALAAKHLARADATTQALVGAGAQAEFQALALRTVRPLTTLRCFDPDPRAVAKLERNLEPYGMAVTVCDSPRDAAEGAGIVTTATAAKVRAAVLEDDWLAAGTHLNAIGGDCPGKTELDPAILRRAKIVVELLEQTRIEGEIQNLPDAGIHGELWELVIGDKPGRESDDEITVFDSVGFALEDYSVLRLVDALAAELEIGRAVDLLPRDGGDPKNLFAALVD